MLVLISEVWGGFSPEAMRFLGELAQANILSYIVKTNIP